MNSLGPTVTQALLQAEPIEILPTFIGVITTPGCIRGEETNWHVRTDLFGFGDFQESCHSLTAI